MKVDLNKLMETDQKTHDNSVKNKKQDTDLEPFRISDYIGTWQPEIIKEHITAICKKCRDAVSEVYPKKNSVHKRKKVIIPNPYTGLVKKATYVTAAMILACAGMLYWSASNSDNVLADVPYDESQVNPVFVVQHIGDITRADIQSGSGDVKVLTMDNDKWHIPLNEDGTVSRITEQVELYEPYDTSWIETRSIEQASFLNDMDGVAADGYVLNEVWFGQDRDSQERSDFTVLTVPRTDGAADLSKITLTNNPEHPGLSKINDGSYIQNGDGNYVVCIHDGDVMRLMFELADTVEYNDVDMFDYDVSDGGYYLSDDYFHMGDKKNTSGQADEKATIHMNAVESGIHSPGNYHVPGVKLAFGGSGIGTDMADEFIENELDTLNIWNYGQQEKTNRTGVTKGIASGVDIYGNIEWTKGISAPNLFGNGTVTGRTDYVTDEYYLTFGRNGFSRTMQAVGSKYGTTIDGLDRISDNNSFWVLDTAPSYGTDGHDIIWGSGSELTEYYRSGDRSSLPFNTSEDGKDHNSFFGMSYTQDFTLSPGYTGPMEFFGYSDDDLWVFAGRVDDSGQVLPDTVVQVCDLGGIHDKAAYYCDLWDMMDKVPYGGDEQNWKLFVFWLEREGLSADCYLNFTLPDAADADITNTGSVVVEAGCYGAGEGDERTFIFDDGSYDRYKGVYDDGTIVTITSGKEFKIPGNSLVNISGPDNGTAFNVSETGRENVWVSTGDGYEMSGIISGTVGVENWVTFASAVNNGTLSIAADASGTPDSGYEMILTLDNMDDMEVSAMDGYNNPIGSRLTDKDGQLDIALAAGETITIYDIPEGTKFKLEPKDAAGYHLSKILADGEVTLTDTTIEGTFPAYIVYQYEENALQAPKITIEQSVSGDWGTEDILLNTGALLSYKITVENPNDVPLSMTVEDPLPEGMEIVKAFLLNDGELNGNVMTWDITLDGKSVTEMSFTCEVTKEGPYDINNSAWVIIDGEAVSSSTSITAKIP